MPNDTIRILFLGDIVGKPGRKAAISFVQMQRQNYDVILANGENASGGKGITPDNAQELFDAGIDGLTSGNHIWHKKDTLQFLDASNQLIRPINYPPGTPGQGYMMIDLPYSRRLAVINLQGRVFMDPVDCPFRSIEGILPEIKNQTSLVFVDFHAEASSEKRAMGFFLDGKVSALVGTHTHVQTNDYQILPEGTAYISDVGMTGPHHSVIGVDSETIVNRYLSSIPQRFDVSKSSIQRIDFVEIVISTLSGRAESIKGSHEFIHG